MTMAPNPAWAAGMRNAAGQLNAKADRVATIVARLDSATSAMTFSGPAADRFRASVATQRGELLKVRSNLAESAAILMRSAAQVEAGTPW